MWRKVHADDETMKKFIAPELLAAVRAPFRDLVPASSSLENSGGVCSPDTLSCLSRFLETTACACDLV